MPSEDQQALRLRLDYFMRRFLFIALGMGLLLPTAAKAESSNQIRYIPSGSMSPVLQREDRIVVNTNAYLNSSPLRGDIISYFSPYSFDQKLISNRETPLPSKAECKRTRDKDRACDEYIKRIVALEGDEVLVTKKGELYLNGTLVNETYLSNNYNCPEALPFACPELSATVPKGHAIVLGDNRGNSYDSRFWPGGPFLPIEKITGRAETIAWPLDRARSLMSSE